MKLWDRLFGSESGRRPPKYRIRPLADGNFMLDKWEGGVINRYLAVKVVESELEGRQAIDRLEGRPIRYYDADARKVGEEP